MSQVEQKSVWHQLLERKVSRRTAIGTAVAAGAVGALPLTITEASAANVAQPNNGAPANPVGDTVRRLPPFRPTERTTADTMTLPTGYRFQVVAPWGEKLNDRGEEIGFNHDFVGYFPLDMLTGGASSTEGLLTINHEYANPLFVGGNTKERTAAQIEAEKKAIGVSVMRVRRSGQNWEMVADPRNRRIDANTEIELTGPVRGTPAVKGATTVRGSVGNCSGGQTPWGTLLTCEENVDTYGPAWPGFDTSHQGWITEIDPFDAAARPKKRTAMGKFRHENAAITVAKNGKVVVYMGDDMRDACVYKFVSRGTYNASNRAANMDLLAEGDLYVADFSRGRWILLDYEKNADLKNAKKADGSAALTSQADVLIDARAAALLARATPTDRPEDIEIHPKTGDVYIALTNNSIHGNFFGQIVKLTEAGSDWAGADFRWEVFATGGPQSGFSSPDNLVFDPYGNLWMVTDSGTGGIYDFLGNNSMFFFPTEGPNAGTAYRFATGPVGAELTGPVWTPDGRTLFVSVQHPGEDTPSLDKPTSTFAAKPGTNIPRPTLVAISGFPGWRE